jgi:hypothetical protein
MTGIIDRLERGGWITRHRDPHDRRAVVVQVVRSRGQELLRMFAGMNAALTQICADYTDAELAVIARFLNQTADAGRAAAEQLPALPLPDPSACRGPVQPRHRRPDVHIPPHRPVPRLQHPGQTRPVLTRGAGRPGRPPGRLTPLQSAGHGADRTGPPDRASAARDITGRILAGPAL